MKYCYVLAGRIVILCLFSIIFVQSIAHIATASYSAQRQHVRRSDTTAPVVTTFHNDTLRTGQNLNETVLTSGNVNPATFGKRVSYPVDGQIYTQPLFLPDVFINGQIHNVVYVATEHDSVYAFDANRTTSAMRPLWQRSFLMAPNVTPVPSEDVYQKYVNKDIFPMIGITGTPVIDTATGILYLVAMTKESGQYVQRLHALDVASGAEKLGSPTVIQATVPGSGYDAVHGTISFNARFANQRPGLLLLNGIVYIGWASFGDSDPYHGWILGYRYTGFSLQQVSAYSNTADGQEGGIWMSGSGLAADAAGSMYLITGNGTFDADKGGRDLSNSIVKLDSYNNLTVTDSFTPFNQTCLDGRDNDVGSGGVLLLPDQMGTAQPHRLIGIGKEGRVYVLNRDNLGGFVTDTHLNCTDPIEEGRTDIDHTLQEYPPGTTKSVFGMSAYWSGTDTSGALLYTGGFGDNVKAFRIQHGALITPPASRTAETFAFSGATPSISSNGAIPGTGIVWTVAPSNCSGPGCVPTGYGALRAYDATDLSHSLYNSEENVARDRLDSYVKFSVPTVVDGKVFVGTQNSLIIYGLVA